MATYQPFADRHMIRGLSRTVTMSRYSTPARPRPPFALARLDCADAAPILGERPVLESNLAITTIGSHARPTCDSTAAMALDRSLPSSIPAIEADSEERHGLLLVQHLPILLHVGLLTVKGAASRFALFIVWHRG